MSTQVKNIFEALSSLDGATVVMEDGVVVPNFMQSLGLDPSEVFESLQKVPTFDPGDQADFPEIPFKPFEAQLIRGSYHGLMYRGNALKRHKIWWQDDIEKGYRKYYYTGWQQMIAMAQCDTKAMPTSVQRLMEKVNEFLTEFDELRMNHGIYTFYSDSKDFIGRHSDKIRSYEKSSWFIVFKLGAARLFEITDLKGNPLFCEKLPEGSAVFMRSDTSNLKTKHAVPVMKEELGESGSIVFRSISDLVDWKEQKKRAAAAKRAKFKLRDSKRLD